MTGDFSKMDSSTLDKALSDEILCRIKDKIESGVLENLTSIWIELWDEEEREKRKVILAEELERVFEDHLHEILLKEQKARDDYVDRIEQLLTEIHDLHKGLEVAIPYEDVENLPLHNMAYHLNKKAEKYRLMRDQIIHKLNELIKKESELCEKLGVISVKLSCTGIPNKNDIKQYENHVIALEHEKTDRYETFLQQRQNIMGLFKELDVKPVLTFEKEIVSDDVVENFKLTKDNMIKLAELQKRLEKRVEESKQIAVELNEKLNVLWNYLEEDEDHRKEFAASHPGHSVSVIASLREEIARCEKKKRENIKKIVGRIRQVLVEEWDKCLVSKEERDKFHPFHNDCFTEDLCDLHELEIEQLKAYYRENEDVFNLITKHERLFNKLLDLESKAKNSDRYKNRGGQLLQEERERKLITKELPAVEEELRNLLKKYEAEKGKPFTSFGVPVEAVLDQQWTAHFGQKTIDKLSRKLGTDKKGRTPLGKRMCTTPANGGTSSKVSRLNSEKAVSSTTKTPKKAVVRSSVFNSKKKSENDEPHTTFLLEPTYDDFQKTLQAKVETTEEKKKVARSTAVKEQMTPAPAPAPRVLRERNNTPYNFLKTATTITKSTPQISSTPLCSPSITRTPKTLPRATRRQSKALQFTPARSRLPLII